MAITNFDEDEEVIFNIIKVNNNSHHYKDFDNVEIE